MNSQLANTPQVGPRHYIGGGNVAGILGVSPYKTPLGEFLVIQAANDSTDPRDAAFFARRKALEPFATEVFENVTGMNIISRNVRYTHEEHAFIRAEIDFETDDGGNGETKTVHPFAAKEWGEQGGDDVPIYVLAQVQHGLGVTGRKHAWVHALVGLDDDRIYRIERQDDIIENIRRAEVKFWNEHVIPNVPPEPTRVEDLAILFPKDTGRVVVADASIEDAVMRYAQAKKMVKSAEAEIEDLGETIKLFMRDASTIVGVDGRVLMTWKQQTAKRFNQAAFAAADPATFTKYLTPNSFRVMRVK